MSVEKSESFVPGTADTGEPTDIVARLRKEACYLADESDTDWRNQLVYEAADEIERLRSEPPSVAAAARRKVIADDRVLAHGSRACATCARGLVCGEIASALNEQADSDDALRTALGMKQ